MVIIFSRSPLAKKSEPVLNLYGARLKIYPQVKFLGMIFNSKLTSQKHFEENLGRCNTRYHSVTLTVFGLRIKANTCYSAIIFMTIFIRRASVKHNKAMECIRTVAPTYGCEILQLYEYNANVYGCDKNCE